MGSYSSADVLCPFYEKDIPKTKDVLKDGWIYLLILGILIVALLVIQLSPLYSALWATVAVPVVMFFDKKKRFTYKNIPEYNVLIGDVKFSLGFFINFKPHRYEIKLFFFNQFFKNFSTFKYIFKFNLFL